MSDEDDLRNKLSGLLDEYLTLEPSIVTEEDHQINENKKPEIIETVQEDESPPPTKIEYPKTALGPAATTTARLFSSLVDENATKVLKQDQYISINETKKIRRDLATANKQLNDLYPSFNSDIERCLDLLKKIQMDRTIIDDSLKRSKIMLRRVGLDGTLE
jgi:hypothetical protein